MSAAARQRAGIAIVSGVMVVLFLAGILKFLGLSEFARAVATWTVVPPVGRPVIVVVIPALEVTIGGAWLLGIDRRRTTVAAGYFLTAISLFYAAHLAVGERPLCGCLGQLAAFEWAQAASEFVLLRNGGMLMCLIIGAMLVGQSPPTHGQATPSSPRGATAGFTLIETLLVVALVATLVATLLPSLTDIRTNARCSRSLATARSHGAVFAAYCNDYRGSWPYVTDPHSHYTILRADDIAVPVVYFQAVNRWNVGLARSYYDGVAVHRVFSFPSQPPTSFTIYNYSQAMLADPAYWNETTRTGPAQWRATNDHEVTFPGAKALLVDWYSGHLRRREGSFTTGSPIGIAFCDGSARQTPLHEILPGYRQFTGWDWHGTYNSVLSRGMHTINGVRGRDVR